MPNRRTPLGLKIWEFRVRDGKRLADQAKALRLSVSYISAIELGIRRVPENYPIDVSNWLGLTDVETAELCKLALQDGSAVENKSRDQSEEIPIAVAQLQRLRARLASQGDNCSDADIKQLAMLARAALGLGSQVVSDLIEILENRLPLIDSDFSLQVDSDASHGPNFRAYVDGKTIIVSESVYDGANRQNRYDNDVLAHELGHLLREHPPRSYDNVRSRKFRHIEREAKLFSREFLLPLSIVQRFNSPKELSRAANVPLHVAHNRMRELNLLRSADEKAKVTKGFEALLDILKGKVSKPLDHYGQPSADIIPFPTQPLSDFGSTKPNVLKLTKALAPRKRSQKQQHSELPLFEFANAAEKAALAVRDRSKEWFDTYGYRGD